MNTATHILSTLCILLVGLCFTACSSHDEYVDDAVVETDDGQYIKLMLHVPAEERTTRANPTPGEIGDGREKGTENENKIKNVMVFVIRDNSYLNADASTTFLYKGYIDDTFDGWTIKDYGVDILFPVKDYRPENNDKVIVIANAGARQNEINTLGDLRDFQLTYAWRYGATLAENDMFVMSSAENNDGLVVLSSHDGTIDNPYVSNLTIQRLAARIDFMYNNTDNGTPSTELLYKVTKDPNDRSSEQLASVHLENIIPVNLMQQPSYIIKRVTSGGDINSAVTYCGLETGRASVAPTNYVIEPHTIAKESTVEDATLTTWYGSTRAKTVFSNPTSYLTNTGISNYTSTIVAGTDLTYFTHHFTLAYTNENTQSMDQHKPQYMTGLLLRAVYEPATVYSNYAAGELTPSGTYTQGTTFWRYSPTRTEMKEEDCLYFDNEAAANTYNTAHPMDMGKVEMFTNGICYYNIWLRHANVESDPHETFPMEFGIVRNNIYRVGVRIFTGPGTPTPDFNGPEHLRLRIFVRKWNKRIHDKIYL